MSKFLCPRCPKQFQSENDLKRHLIKMHGVERRMKGKPEAKTVKIQVLTTEDVSRELEGLDGDAYEIEANKKWVSEAEHKREMDEFGRQNEALAVVCADLKANNVRLEAIQQHYEQMPKENQSIYWTSICDDEIQDEFIGQKFFPDLHKWYERLGVLLKEGDKQ